MPATAAIDATGLVKVFGQLRAVDGISFTLFKGETLGIVGESGCGKSTLGRMVAGIMPPSGGQVLFQDQDLATLPPAKARAASLKIQMI